LNENNNIPRYAVRLVSLIIIGAVVFFGGLNLFVPEGSKLTGSYDAKSLLYIASAPVAYGGSDSCGATSCHEDQYNIWSQGAHGIKKEQSKCEICHGPLGKHPKEIMKLPLVRGDGDIVELCLTCHRQMKARSATGQPQIAPQQHPYPHEGVLKCIKCHNPHSPAIGAAKNSAKAETVTKENNEQKTSVVKRVAPAKATSCFSCHGKEGRGGFAPAIAAQKEQVLKSKLAGFKSGELKGSMMNGVASGLKDEDIAVVAEYFSKLP